MLPADRPDPPRTLGEATAQLDALWGVVGAVRDQNDELRAQVQELLDRLDKHSGNSSKPPSSDSTAQKKNRPKRSGTRGKSPRRRGAQPGHPKHERAMVPESEVGDVQRYFPPALCGCGTALVIDAEPACRHQVFDLPVVRYTCTEHQLFGGCCPGCGERHVARTPQTVPSGQMGPGLVAWIALMGGAHRASVRQIQRLLAEQWSLAFSSGAISEAQGLACRALRAPYEAIGEHVRSAAVAHADETRHPRGGNREHAGTWWLWALVTTQATFLGVHFSRGMAAAAELLGHFEGFLVTDDYVAYNGVPSTRRQLCWSHQIRHFSAIAERRGVSGQIGRQLLLLARVVIRTRHRVDDGRIDEAIYRRRMQRLRTRIGKQIERGAGLAPDSRTGRQCRHLLKREPMLWTFLVDRRIPLDNNRAERALRPYVIWRKLSYASHSRRGDRFRAQVLSVSETARQQDVPLYPFLRRICTEVLSAEGVTTRLPLGTARLPG